MKNSTPAKATVSLLIGIIATLSADAQKLPNVQKRSVYAPANIKTDGKTTEWDNKFEASNSSTALFYTMANDNDKLYLTVQATDATAINKMLNGGITFTIKSPDKSIKPVVINCLIFQAKGLTDVQKKINDKESKMDSVLGPVNSQVAAALKEIGITGVKEIPDSLISVYNEYGIKEAVQYDSKRALTCEFAIPLKYIGHLINADAFKYNVMLKGIKMRNVSIVMNGSPVAPGSAGAERATTLISQISMGGGGGSFQDAFNDTDFSGTYTLAKKQ